jgi:hypothetical protein
MALRPEDEKTEIRPMSEEGEYPCLEILSGPRGGGRFFLKPGKNQIGRSSDNDVVLDDSSVSRRHAAVEITANGAILSDLGSRNGTKVKGRKIDQPVPLEQGAQVKIGLYILRFLTEPAAPAEAEGTAVAEPAPAEAPLPAVPEEMPVGEEPSLSEVKKRSPRWLIYLALAAGLAVALVLSGPQLLKMLGPKKEVAKKRVGKPGEVGQALPVDKTPIPGKPPGVAPVFLDFSSSPIPAQVFFGDQQVGMTPFRISSNLHQGKWYEARALFQLPEIGEVLEERIQFTSPEGATVIPVNFPGKIGIFKVVSLPRDAQLYLEGYFEKDPYRAKPIKFAEIVFGKPVYVPFGRYILELRRSRQIGMSQTYLDEVVYRREFVINKEQTDYAVDVNEEGLKVFPVQITSIPPGATVFIDEKEAGKTPYTGAFPTGEHLMTLKREGYFDFVQVMKMEINMPYVAEIQLKTSEAGELVNRADLLMKEERYAEALPILVDAYSKRPTGRETAQISYLIGVSYLRQKSLKEAQDYFLKAMEHDDYKYPARLGIASVTLEQGDRNKALQLLVEVLVASEDPKVRAEAGNLFQRISPLKSVMYVTSEPPGARVFVNGMEMAEKTPMILLDLGVGSYRVQVRKEGYEETELKLNLGVSEFRPVVAKLKRIAG